MVGAPPPRYAVVETKDLVETHRLIDHGCDAEVVLAPGRGGMVTRYRVAGDEILFLDQATLRDHSQNVRGGIPVLFPIAGRLTDDRFSLPARGDAGCRSGPGGGPDPRADSGSVLSMAQHGFARKIPWRIVATETTTGAALTLMLEDSESTLMAWPFRFRITFRYELRDGALTIEQRYENLDQRPMPIHPGLHPYFRVDDWRKREAHVVTSATRAFDNRAGSLVTLSGPIDLGAGEVDLQLLNHDQSHISLQRPDAGVIQLSYDDPATVIAVWTVPSRGFVCIEPWARQADALNRGDAVVVPPGGAHRALLRIACTTPDR